MNIAIGRTPALDAQTGRAFPLGEYASTRMAAVISLEETAYIMRDSTAPWLWSVWAEVDGYPEIIGAGDEQGEAADEALDTLRRWQAGAADADA